MDDMLIPGAALRMTPSASGILPVLWVSLMLILLMDLAFE